MSSSGTEKGLLSQSSQLGRLAQTGGTPEAGVEPGQAPWLPDGSAEGEEDERGRIGETDNPEPVTLPGLPGPAPMPEPEPDLPPEPDPVPEPKAYGDASSR
jgi:hypothetical protein